MYNDIFSIGPLTVHGYGLMIAIGVLVALIVSDNRAKKRGLNGDIVYGMVLWTVVLGFASAKVLFILTDLKNFIANPVSFLKGSGFVVFGGIIGGIITIWCYCKIKKVSVIDYLDLVVVGVALAQGFGRIGCLLAGCCYGRPTDSFIGITFTHSDFAPNNIKLLPTQIMMSIGDFIIAGLLLLIVGKLEKKLQKEQGLDTLPKSVGGRLVLIYLGLYSIGRFFIEFFRNDYRGNIGFLSTSQFIGILMLVAVCGAYCFFFMRKKGATVDVAKTEDEETIVSEEATTSEEVDEAGVVESESEETAQEAVEE